MMIRTFFLVGLVFSSLSLPAASQENPIVQQMRVFIDEYNRADAEAIGRLFSDDAVVLPSTGKAIVGREAIVAHYAATFSQGVGDLRYKIIEIRQAGPSAAMEVGDTQFSAGEVTIFGRSLHFWELRNGTWLITRNMYQILGREKKQ